jgi:hypothetical protein
MSKLNSERERSGVRVVPRFAAFIWRREEESKLKTVIVMVKLLLATAPAYAWETHTIESVNGDSIVLDDGRVFEPQESVDWSAGDHVIVNDSGDKIINKNSSDGPVDVDETD